MKPTVVLTKSRLAFPGGLEKVTLRLARQFAHRGCEVIILTTSDQKMALPPFDEGKIEVLSPTHHPSFYHLLNFNRACEKWLEKHSYDIAFGMERTTLQSHLRAGSGVHAAFLKRRALVSSPFKRLSFALNPLHLSLLSLEKKAFEDRELKKIFVNSHMVEREILTHYSPTAKIEVVHNGVEWKALEEPFNRSLQKRREKIELLFVGNGYRRKGLEFLLLALAQLNSFSFHLSVVGRDKETCFFKQLAQKLGLENKVTFHGATSSVLPFLESSDVLLLPTLYDPFANVTLEALAMGLFVVTTPFNGASEILTPQSGALIEDLFDVESMKKTLSVALHENKEESKARPRRESIQHLDFPNQLDKIVQNTLQK